ncbi:PREDICTED: melatonin receptor type 1B [Pterocles gutturalis]|nr:PREDICTED: melatonin receptor type 1B [Pterocles gutturalis]
MGPDAIHTRVLRELAEVLTKSLYIIYHQSWLTREVPVDWRLANVMSIYKKDHKEDAGNYRPVILTLVMGKVMEQTCTGHVQDNQEIRPSQHGFMKGRSCLTNLISFYDKVTHSADEGKAVDVVYLDFSRTIGTLSPSILLEKLAAHGLDGGTLHWIKNWQDGRAQRVVVNGLKYSWWPVTNGNAFVVSLALADLVVALYPYPLVLLAIFHNGWTLGEMHCKASGFVMGLSVIGSIFNITAIAINRYCYICHSFAYDKVYSCWNTMLYVSLVWVLTVIATVPNFFVGSLKYDPRVYSCTFVQTASSYYTIAVVVIHFIIPITIVSFCYLRIWGLVLQVRRRVKSETKLRLKPSDFRNFLTMFVVFVIFAFCWAPLNFIGLAVAINPMEMAPKVPEWLFIISYFMAYFNSCLNAIIYGLLNQNFRNEYKRILLSLWMPRLFFQDTSKGGTDGQKSRPSPALNNNDQMKTDTL